MTEINYNAPPTCAAFMKSAAFGRIIAGPVGSGKTTACMFEMLRRSCEQAPAKDGLRYTRQSSFQLDPDGRIVTSQGFPLLDENNRPLIVPPESGPIEVTPQGVVGTSEGEIGRIRLVTFTDEQTMRKIGGGLYESDEEPMDADGTAEIHQGAVEGSNVQAILEVTNMIEIMRRYQSAQKILDTEHELERRAIEKLARAV